MDENSVESQSCSTLKYVDTKLFLNNLCFESFDIPLNLGDFYFYLLDPCTIES